MNNKNIKKTIIKNIIFYLQNILVVKNQIHAAKSWLNIARANQLPPSQDWQIWILLAGRGFGKTRCGAETVHMLCQYGLYRHVALIGHTIRDVQNIMIEGPSGLIQASNREETTLKYLKNSNKIIWSNGAIATSYSAYNASSLRGPQFDLVWIDELCKFHNASTVFKYAEISLRLNNKPKMIITTTPRPSKILAELIKNPGVVVTTGSTYENQDNLDAGYIADLAKYHNTAFGQQEIFARLMINNSRWIKEDIRIRVPPPLEQFERIIISVDPALTYKQNSSEHGIVVAGIFQQEYFILADLSIQAPIYHVVDIIQAAICDWHVTSLVIETNVLGDFVYQIFNQQIPIHIKQVKATQSKIQRAQYALELYKRSIVWHAQHFEYLEQQMLSFHMYDKEQYEKGLGREYDEEIGRLDRLDAMTWAIIELSINTNQWNISNID